MSRVKGKDTKIEVKVRSFLFQLGFRFRKNVRSLAGSPDIVLPKHETVVFVNGCFWHGHKNCKNMRLPKTRKDYWFNKIEGNAKRDVKNRRKLRTLGWKTVTLWECRLKKDFDSEMIMLLDKIDS